jgi:hypothetical protein
MQHLELDPKAVRMAGDWSPSGNSNPCQMCIYEKHNGLC